MYRPIFFTAMHLLSAALLVLMPLDSIGQSDPSSSSVRAQPQVLFGQLLHEPAQEGLVQLDALAVDPALKPAERDAIAFDIVRQLRQLPPGRVDPRVLQRLQNWVPQAWQRHEESSNHVIPRFNVAAAAYGLENQWTYAEGLADGIGSGERSLAEALDRFGEDPDSPYARGLRASLGQAAPQRRARLIELCQGKPVLSEQLLPEAWLANDDHGKLSAWLSRSPGARVAAVLARAREQLPAQRFLPLAAAAQAHEDPSIRALAVARQTDAWVEIMAWPEPWALELWHLLDDEALTTTAAIQLARLDAARRWRSNPARAPSGALDSKHLERIEQLAATLPARRVRQ